MRIARSGALRSLVVCTALLVLAATANAQLSEGPLSPGVIVNDATSGTAVWVNPQDADASDDAWASTNPGGVATQFLKATSFGFSVPSTSQILGIEADIERSALVGTIIDDQVSIVKGGVIVGSANRALPGMWPTTDATVTYGSPSDLWGTTFTPTDINDTGFGVAIAVTNGIDVAAVDHITLTVYYQLCAAAPAGSCRTSEKSILVVNDKTPDSKDKIVWKWIKGQATSTADFSDPINSASYALCVYEGPGETLISQSIVPPDMIKWKPISTKGFKYLDKNLVEDGVQKIVVKASVDPKAKIIFKAKGANIDDITPPLTLPVLVQMVNSDSGICWEGTFEAGDIKKNEAGKFKGRALP